MKKQTIQDERVLAQRRKIGSDTCSILMIVLLLSILVQQYLFNAPFSQYAAEFICFLGASVYILIRNIASGNNLFGENKRPKGIIILNSIVCGVTIAVINGVFNYARYKQSYIENMGMFAFVLLISFISGTAASLGVLSLIYFFNNKKQKKIERTMDERENDYE